MEQILEKMTREEYDYWCQACLGNTSEVVECLNSSLKNIAFSLTHRCICIEVS